LAVAFIARLYMRLEVLAPCGIGPDG
jgi:hypothetical protein